MTAIIRRLLSKLRGGTQVAGLISNWPTWVAEAQGLRRSGLTTYRLRNGVVFKTRVGTVDRAMIPEIWMRDVYTPAPLRIRETDTVVDIGANVGVFSVYAGVRATKGRVIAFEPIPQSFALLQANIRGNHLDHVECVNKAIAAASGERRLTVTPIPTRSSLYGGPPNQPVAESIPIRTLSLASILDTYGLSRIDFLKMDCEGAEYEILLSASQDVMDRISSISMEYHPAPEGNGTAPSSRSSAETLVTFLEGYGFETWFHARHDMLYAAKSRPSDVVARSGLAISGRPAARRAAGRR